MAENEVSYFRRVHNLAPPINPEGLERPSMTEEEMDYFRKVHQLSGGKPQNKDLPFKQLEEVEVAFFK